VLNLPFEPSQVAAAAGPLVSVVLGTDGRPVAARAAGAIAAAPARVWETLADPTRFASKVPMIHSARVDGDRVRLDLKFRIALFSVGFRLDTRMSRDEGRWLELRYVAGEPRDTSIRFDLTPAERPDRTVLYTSIAFDIMSLGWLVKAFLKHHPEIQFGVFPGTALSLLDAVRRSAEP